MACSTEPDWGQARRFQQANFRRRLLMLSQRFKHGERHGPFLGSNSGHDPCLEGGQVETLS